MRLADAEGDQRRRIIPDSYWVIPGRFAAGEYPGNRREEEARRRLAVFLAAGIDNFVDLTEAGEYGLAPYAPFLPSTARHRRFPVPDLGVPAPAQMTLILDAVDAALAEGRGVYAHCWGGVGRTGTVVGCWLVRRGLSAGAAFERIAAWRQDIPEGDRPSPETAEQRAFVRCWGERELRREHGAGGA